MTRRPGGPSLSTRSATCRVPHRRRGAGFTVELVIETHFHADFLSGHLELAKATGAKIVYSSVAETEFESVGVDDGQRYALGDVTLEFRHTPGHTPESLSIVIYEHADDESRTASSPATPSS